MKMEQTECSETSAYTIQTPRNYPEESTQMFELSVPSRWRRCVSLAPRGTSNRRAKPQTQTPSVAVTLPVSTQTSCPG